jgi:hypothetical protein
MSFLRKTSETLKVNLWVPRNLVKISLEKATFDKKVEVPYLKKQKLLKVPAGAF